LVEEGTAVKNIWRRRAEDGSEKACSSSDRVRWDAEVDLGRSGRLLALGFSSLVTFFH
jgi:hypothetical protein